MIRVIILALLSAAAAAVIVAPAGACTIVPPPPGSSRPSAAMLDANARSMVQQARAVLEVATLEAETGTKPGAVRVLRVMKGDYKRGDVLAALPSGSAACGPDTITPGQRGIIVIHHEPSTPLILGPFVSEELVEAIRRQGLLRDARNPDTLSPQDEERLKRAREQHKRDWAARAPEMAFQDEGRKLAERIRTDPHFGGFIFRSSPEPHAIVMFTGDAEARLRRYTRDPRFKAQRVDFTLAQLEAMKDEMGNQLSGLGLQCFTVDGDEEHNTVTVTTPEQDKVRRAIAEGRLKLPPNFRLLPGACMEWR